MGKATNRRPSGATLPAFGAGLLVAAMAVWAQAGEPLAASLSAPDGTVLRLAPGDSGLLRLRAQGSSAFGATLSFYYGAGEYTDIGPAPAAGCASLGTMTAQSQPVMFDPTLAGGDLECIYTVRRNADSINDLQIQFRPPTFTPGEIAPLAFTVGVAAEPRLSVRRESAVSLPDGRAQSIVRLTVHNSAPVGLQGLSAGECYYGMSPFDIDGNIPGGCGDNFHFGGICFAVDVPYGFGFSALDANSRSSCLVQLTSRQPYSGPLSYGIGLMTELMQNPATGGRILVGSGQPRRLLELVLDGVFQEGFD
jgi:hypothetical protein